MENLINRYNYYSNYSNVAQSPKGTNKFFIKSN